MTPFRVKPLASQRPPLFARAALFDAADLARRPYRSGASRSLALALATMSAGGAAAGGLWSSNSPNSYPQLLGDIAMPSGPILNETIDPDVASALVRRLFAEAGFSLSEAAVEVGGGLSAHGFDETRGVGFTLLGGDSFSSPVVWAQYLERTLGEWNRIADDPRDHLEDWQRPLTVDEQSEIDRALQVSGQGISELRGSEDERIACIDVHDLTITQVWPGTTLEARARVEARAEALRRLERQVVEFLEFLQTQGM